MSIFLMRCLKSYENEQICGRVRDEVFLFGLRGFFFKIWVSKLAKTLNLEHWTLKSGGGDWLCS